MAFGLESRPCSVQLASSNRSQPARSGIMKNPLLLLLLTAALGSPALAADKLAVAQPPPGKAGGALRTDAPYHRSCVTHF